MCAGYPNVSTIYFYDLERKLSEIFKWGLNENHGLLDVPLSLGWANLLWNTYHWLSCYHQAPDNGNRQNRQNHSKILFSNIQTETSSALNKPLTSSTPKQLKPLKPMNTFIICYIPFHSISSWWNLSDKTSQNTRIGGSGPPYDQGGFALSLHEADQATNEDHGRQPQSFRRRSKAWVLQVFPPGRDTMNPSTQMEVCVLPAQVKKHSFLDKMHIRIDQGDLQQLPHMMRHGPSDPQKADLEPWALLAES